MTQSLSHELKQTMTIAAPLAGAYLAEVAMVLVDHVMVGRLGALELAAVGLLGNAAFEALIFITAVVSIVGILVAHSRGAEKPHEIGHHVAQGLWAAFVLGVPATALCWVLGDILALTGQDPRVIALGREYVEPLSWSLLPGVLFIALRAYTSAMSRAVPVLVITVLTVVAKVPVTYVLVFGGFGVPAMGVAGAGWATTIVVWGMFLAMAWYVSVASGLREHTVFSHILEFDWREILKILRLGMPIGGIALLEGGMFIAVVILMGVIGADALAANEVVFGWTSMTFVFSLGLGEAAGIRVAHELGANRPADSRRAGLLAVCLGFVTMGCFSVAFIFIPDLLAGAFLDTGAAENAAVIELAVALFFIAAVFQLTDGLQAIATRALRGMRDTLIPMWIASLGYWAFGIGGGWILAFPLGYGPEGLWWGLACGLTVTGCMLLLRFHLLSKAAAEGRRPDLLTPEPVPEAILD